MKKIFVMIALVMTLALLSCSEPETRFEVKPRVNGFNETSYVVVDLLSEQKRFTIVSPDFQSQEEAQAFCDSVNNEWRNNPPKTE